MNQRVASWLAIALVAATSICNAQTPDGKTPRAGTFKQVEGEAWLGRADARRPATPGVGVQANERISTGEDGAATVTLKDGTVVTLGPNTTVNVTQFEYNSTTQEGSFLLDLLKGSVRVVTGLLSKANPESVKVKTPTSVVGVRGTDFIVQVQPANP
jgi:hypothetical protein